MLALHRHGSKKVYLPDLTDCQVDSSINRLVKALQLELRRLLEQRDAVVARHQTVRKSLIGLAAMFGPQILDSELQGLVTGSRAGRIPGLTNACRTILLEASKPMSTREICYGLQDSDPGVLKNQKNPVATVNTILNRLKQYGEARSIEGEGTKLWEATG